MGLFSKIGGVAGTFFGGPIGGAIGGAAGGLLDDYGEKAYDNYSAAEAATKAFDRQVWMASNAYQLKRKDLEAAGYNPMLAVTGGGAQFPGVAVARTDFGGSSTGQLRREQAENVQADTANKEALNDQIVATIDNVVADTVVKRGTAAKVAQETENLKEALTLIWYQKEKTWSEAQLNTLRAQLLKMEIPYREDFLRAVNRLRQSEAYLSEMSQSEAEQAAEMWNSAMGDVWKYIAPLIGAGKGLPLPRSMR